MTSALYLLSLCHCGENVALSKKKLVIQVYKAITESSTMSMIALITGNKICLFLFTVMDLHFKQTVI